MLRRPLGRWLLPTDQLRRTWPFYFDPPTDTLFKTNNTGYTVHARELSGHSFNESAYTEQLPITAVPISVHPTDTCWRKDGRFSRQTLAPTQQLTTTWRSKLQALSPWEKSLLFGLKILNTTKLIEMLITGKAVFTTDGSAPDKASFGWAIAAADKTRLATCFGPTQGFKPSSYRAEGYGALSVLRFLIRFIQHHQIETMAPPQGFCDNESIVENVKEASSHTEHFANTTLKADWDVINEIVVSRRELLHPPSLTWIKSHQDDHKPYEQLSLPAQLNVDADNLAESYMIHHCDQHRKVAMLPHSGCILHLPEGTITNKLKREIVKAKRGPPLLAFLSKKYQWTPTTASFVDWELHGHAVKNTRDNPTFLKFIHDMLPVGHTLNRRDPTT